MAKRRPWGKGFSRISVIPPHPVASKPQASRVIETIVRPRSESRNFAARVESTGRHGAGKQQRIKP